MNDTKSIFISYRRDDSAGYSGRIYDRLEDHFGADAIFIDIHSIEAGLDFVDLLDEAVNNCSVLLAIIGKQWLTISDKYGRRRLDDPEDFVRIEIQTALFNKDIRVIPILVRNTDMPPAEGLPKEIATLARRNAHTISDDRFHNDLDDLIEIIDKTLGKADEKPDSTHEVTSSAALKITASGKSKSYYKLNLLELVERQSISAISPNDRVEGDYPLYGAGGEIARIDQYQFEGKYLILGRVGASILKHGRSVYITQGGEKFSCNSNVYVFSATEKANIDFLYYYFMIFDFSPFVYGSARASIDWSKFSEAMLIMPNLEIQSEIVNDIKGKIYENVANTTEEQLLIIKDVLEELIVEMHVDYE